jgi:hypothetical protein
MWKKITTEIKERFMNNETLSGIAFILMALALFNPAWLIFVAQAYLLYEGIRRLWINPIKQEAIKQDLVQARKSADYKAGVR